MFACLLVGFLFWFWGLFGCLFVFIHRQLADMKYHLEGEELG